MGDPFPCNKSTFGTPTHCPSFSSRQVISGRAQKVNVPMSPCLPPAAEDWFPRPDTPSSYKVTISALAESMAMPSGSLPSPSTAFMLAPRLRNRQASLGGGGVKEKKGYRGLNKRFLASRQIAGLFWSEPNLENKITGGPQL